MTGQGMTSPAGAWYKTPLYVALLVLTALSVGWTLGRTTARQDYPNPDASTVTESSGASSTQGMSTAVESSDSATSSDLTAGLPSRAASNIHSFKPNDCTDVRSALESGCAGDRSSMQQAGTRERILRRLAEMQSPRDKAALLATLIPVSLPVEDLQPLLAEFEAVRTSNDPALRADSLTQMAQWDKSDAMEDTLLEGLGDAEPEVVNAAITAVMLSNVRSQATKDALLVLAHDAPPDSEMRHAALEALRGFSLNRKEYSIFARTEESADRLRE